MRHFIFSFDKLKQANLHMRFLQVRVGRPSQQYPCKIPSAVASLFAWAQKETERHITQMPYWSDAYYKNLVYLRNSRKSGFAVPSLAIWFNSFSSSLHQRGIKWMFSRTTQCPYSAANIRRSHNRHSHRVTAYWPSANIKFIMYLWKSKQHEARMTRNIYQLSSP